MTNAKIELQRMLAHINVPVKCALIHSDTTWEEDTPTFITGLKVNHTPAEFNDFMNSLDFQYNSGFGSQNLFGTVWFTDGTWMDRGEYDGSEWWEHHRCPQVPSELL